MENLGGDDRLLDELTACERRVWAALMTGDPAADEACLSDDFLGVYPTGRSDRAGHTEQLSEGPTVVSYDMLDPEVRPLGDDVALLVYEAEYRRPGRDDSERMLVSSIWRRDGDGWINVFSQDTPVAADG